MTSWTTTSRMDPDELARAARAAAGTPLRPTAPVAMGIRYRPTTTARPAPAEQPAWVRILAATPTEALERLDHDAPGSRLPRRRRTAVASPEPTRPAPARAPATDQRRQAPAPATPAVAAVVEASATAGTPRVLRRWDAYACRRCGSRYNHHTGDHPCGRLTPITVTVTPRTGQPAPDTEVLGSYDAWQCQACGHRYHQQGPDHGCGPLSPVTVTITTRATGGPA